MRIVALCKQRPQGRDLFSQSYGRFYHLPRLLAVRGHEVHLLLLGYRNEPNSYRREGNLHWHTVALLPYGPVPYLTMAERLVNELKPDWVIGLSDTWYGILAERVARHCGARCLIDAYDNYESYISWLKPLHWAWRRAVATADVVTAAGPQLASLMSMSAGNRHVDVIPMAADPIFLPLDKRECRRRLGLPESSVLVGYSGSLHPNRGIEFLFEVFARLHAIRPDIELVLSGRLANGIHLPQGVHWLSYRPPDDVPLIINSLDLLFALNKPGAFGNFSYPAKIYEALACGVPVLASDVPGTAWVLGEYPESLAKPGDVDDFVRKSCLLLSSMERPRTGQLTWRDSAERLAELLGYADTHSHRSEQ